MDDEALLASGDHAALLARYEHWIVQRCVAAMRGHADAEDVAQDVKLRLWRELERGKRYAVPFAVVVRKVTEWTLKDHWAGRDTTVSLPEGWEPDPAPDFADEVDGRAWLESVLAELPGRQREVWELRLLEGCDIDEIAARLGIDRNAVDQALHNGRRKLRQALAR
jgi:RNA polymerase sigma-70 factor (ECF subfamily)